MRETSDRHIQRVLMTGDTVGGVWTFTLELARTLTLAGTKVVLATMGRMPDAAQLAEASAIPGLCLLSSHFKLEWMDDPWADVEEAGHWLLQLEREYCPDVIHLNSLAHGALPWTTPTLLTVHSCVLSWWIAVKGEAAPTAWDRYQSEVSRSLKAVDLLTAPSHAMAASLRRFYDTSVDCIVIPNGLAAVNFRETHKEPFIFAAGRLWDEGKNVSALTGAAANLSWPVCLAGDGGDSAIKNVRALGRLPAREMAGWYALASIYALPARYEPFGLSILEAALSGCALVLGDIPSLRENWAGAALFVAPEDHAALEQTLRKLIDDSRLLEAMAARAYARARNFDLTAMSNLYLTSYRNAIAHWSQPCVS